MIEFREFETPLSKLAERQGPQAIGGLLVPEYLSMYYGESFQDDQYFAGCQRNQIGAYEGPRYASELAAETITMASKVVRQIGFDALGKPRES